MRSLFAWFSHVYPYLLYRFELGSNTHEIGSHPLPINNNPTTALRQIDIKKLSYFPLAYRAALVVTGRCGLNCFRKQRTFGGQLGAEAQVFAGQEYRIVLAGVAAFVR